MRNGTDSDEILPPRADPRRLSEVEEHVRRFVENVQLGTENASVSRGETLNK
jgi:hypothetical protein